MRDVRSWPDVLRFLDGDSGQISLGENLESVPAFTFCRKPANALFQFAKACQPVEKPALKIAPRLWMGRRHYWILLVISRFNSPRVWQRVLDQSDERSFCEITGNRQFILKGRIILVARAWNPPRRESDQTPERHLD